MIYNYKELTPEGVAWAIPTFIVLQSLIYLFCKKIRIRSSGPMWLFSIVVAFFFAREIFSIPARFPDSSLYIDLIHGKSAPEDQSLGLRLYAVVTAPLKLISLGYYESYVTIQAFIYVVSIVYLRLAFNRFLVRKGLEKTPDDRVIYLLAALYPSTMMFIATPLREYLLILGVALIFYGLSRNQKSASHYFHLVAGFSLVICTRPQLILVLPIIYLINHPERKKAIAWAIASLFLLPYAFTELTTYQLTPGFIAMLRSSSVDNYIDSGFVYGAVEWQSYFDIIFDLPMLFLQFVFAPLPILIDVNPFGTLTYLLDVVFVIVLIFASIKNAERDVYNSIAIFFIMAVFFSGWEFYIGGAVRHRMPLVLMLLPLAADMISRSLRLNKRNSRRIDVQ